MKVFTNGVFDVLSAAHFNLINYCRYLAGNNGEVVVAIDSDRKVQEDKGSYRPIFAVDERMGNLLFLRREDSTPLIDLVLVFDTNKELHDLIKHESPDIIVKGDDWMGNVVGSDLAKVVYYPRNNSYSSTSLINKVLLKHDHSYSWQQNHVADILSKEQK